MLSNNLNNQKSTTFYIVRHAESKANTENIVGADEQLTLKGKHQAKDIAEKLKKIKFSAIFSSDLIRAKETARIIGSKWNLNFETDKRLREWFIGKFEGTNGKIFKEKVNTYYYKASKLTDSEKFDFRIDPSMETPQETVVRLKEFLKEKSKYHEGGNVLVICHGAVMRFFLIDLGYAVFNELPEGFSIIENTGYYVIQTAGENFILGEIFGVNKLSNL